MSSAVRPADDPGTPIAAGSVEDKQLRRLRWAVRATLALGVAASVAANVLHARPNPISQIIAAWPPLALLLTVELISRVPHHRWHLGAIRVTAAAVIAVIAAWVSYWHLVGVAARYGEAGYGAAYLLPISVDGLVIVASVSLVEISARIRVMSPQAAATAATEHHTTPALPAHATETPTPASTHVGLSDNAASGANLLDACPLAGAGRTVAPTPRTRVSGETPQLAVAAGPPSADANADRPPLELNAAQTPPDPVTVPAAGKSAGALSETAGPAAETSGSQPTSAEVATQPTQAADTAMGEPSPESATGGDREEADPPGGADTWLGDTAAAVAYWRRRDPALQPGEVAERIGRSERTVRRHWQPRPGNRTARANGHPAGKRRR
ncbi:DUF2637 domain-containing protein [Micromonospora sp. WMMD710]|uniref:DUF2637 domain-containing protein n=1 Tax=Micromonospora sp. WMMD710 TaxID=3016085 RepID=UPI002415C4F8|nr:DUF2637 domain-containing protein [Micromonospora sp. WMMD710]MDG4760353.1 DUF2637 domain-containing protein [Micromonospora sp. WMMD710]